MSKSYLKLANSSILLDKEGFLVSLDDWSEQAAKRIAELEGIKLMITGPPCLPTGISN